jgi:hypothetical protein
LNEQPIRHWDGLVHVVETTIGEQGVGEVEFKVCRRCGAMVADQDLHDLWHIRLASPQTYR